VCVISAFQREGPVEGTVVRIHTTLSPYTRLNHLVLHQHPELTPAQRRYLAAAAGPRSAERVYGLVNRHYLNVLRRSIRPGGSPAHRLLRSQVHGAVHRAPQRRVVAVRTVS
uniref:Uncharacterized protein n=1 Tax=Gadus morhua TaxID=8049 RepID=A0A8C4ZYG4_GADMO